MKISTGLLDGLRLRNREMVLDQEEVSSVVVLFGTKEGRVVLAVSYMCVSKSSLASRRMRVMEFEGRRVMGTVLQRRH